MKVLLPAPVTPITAMSAHGAPALTGSVTTADWDLSLQIASRSGESARTGDVLSCVDILDFDNPDGLRFGNKMTGDSKMDILG